MRLKRVPLAALAAIGLLFGIVPALADQNGNNGDGTRTPIQHLVVIYQENVSFDHYFGTYPNALNPAGEPAFHALPGTPAVNGLTQALLTSNPNLGNPQRLDRSQAHTCDQDHVYKDEQLAADGGKMDLFVQHTGSQPPDPTGKTCLGTVSPVQPNYAVMDYYDGNTVTALWNYAQHFAMSDNSFGTNYGPSTVGAVNLVAGNTFGVACPSFSGAVYCGTNATLGTIFGDPQPAADMCDTRDTTTFATGRNVGDLLNSANITWGWFTGGFTDCNAAHPVLDQNGVTHSQKDYIPHHEPFQYYSSTSNPYHLAPAGPIGRTDQANHQYDLTNFWTAVDAGQMPAVSFLKAPGFQDGHAGYSNPLDEQTFLVQTINGLEQRPEWQHTAVVIAYDDSDGWYDHVFGPLQTQSQTVLDALTAPGQCGSDPAAVPGGKFPQQARCGLGPRLPLLVVSPFAKANFVDHTLTNQASILRFIEDNWGLGRIGGGSVDATAGTLNGLFNFNSEEQQRRAGKLFLDPATGLVTPPHEG